MKRPPNSKSNLDRAISRYAGGDAIAANELSVSLANAIVAQLLAEGVVKGGSSLKFRFGDEAMRVTRDLDTSYRTDLDSFLKSLGVRLAEGWNGFTGRVEILKQATPRGVPFDYIMQPCEVHLNYLGNPWRSVDLEIGHNEIGDADAYDLVDAPGKLSDLVEFLAFPPLGKIPLMQLEHQVAQKLHGATEPKSKRAHDLIDLQLILASAEIDISLTARLCRKLFKYRRRQAWPAQVVKSENWDAIYDNQKMNLPVLASLDEAIAWANNLIARIDAAK